MKRQLKPHPRPALLIAVVLAALVLIGGAPLRTVAAQHDETAVDNLLAGLTLEQQVAQMFMVTLHGSVITQTGAAFLRDFQPGFISLFTENVTDPAGVARLTNDFQRTMREAGGIPLIIAVDQEGGVVARLTEAAGFTVLPAPIVLAAAGPAMAERAAGFTAGQLAALGIHMNLAPVADLETNPANPIIRRRAFGSDPAWVGEVIAGYVRGLQAGGVLATLKHFPGHGEAADDSHAVLQPIDLPRERLETVELVPFRAGIDAGAAAVMVAHIWYPVYDDDRIPASLSPAIVTGLLRGDLGFDGLIVTDALDMNAVDLEYPFAEAAVRAVEAGVDVLALGPSAGLETAQAAFEAILSAVDEGRITREQIAQAARRILEAKMRYGVLDAAPVDPDLAAAAATDPALIADLFAAAVTVVRDDGDQVPLPVGASVAMIFPGTRYDIQRECAVSAETASVSAEGGVSSSEVASSSADTEADGWPLRWLAYNPSPSADEIAGAVRLAQAADRTVVWTENADVTPEQAALVNALPAERTLAVALWSPYDGLAFPDVAGYMALYAPSPAAVPAACRVLFGLAPALGTFPLRLAGFNE